MGFNSSPAIFSAITKNKKMKYLGIIALIIPVGIYFYYIIIESWCLSYSVNYLFGNMDFTNKQEATNFFNTLTGQESNGDAFKIGINHLGIYVLFAVIINFILISKGISKGIEKFCLFAMPTLLIISIIILIRVLTLGTPDLKNPENNVSNGLGFMWNPSKAVVEVKGLNDNKFHFYDQIFKDTNDIILDSYNPYNGSILSNANEIYYNYFHAKYKNSLESIAEDKIYIKIKKITLFK